jgi:hypothetical protein
MGLSWHRPITRIDVISGKGHAKPATAGFLFGLQKILGGRGRRRLFYMPTLHTKVFGLFL